jgi:hypothetical protein
MSQRYQREIEGILKQSGKLKRVGKGGGSGPSFWQLVWIWASRLLRGHSWSQPGRLILIAVSLLLSALIIRAIVPGIAGPVAWAGILLFILAYAMFFVRPRQMEKRWRGQPLDEPGRSWWDRIRKKIG